MHANSSELAANDIAVAVCHFYFHQSIGGCCAWVSAKRSVAAEQRPHSCIAVRCSPFFRAAVNLSAGMYVGGGRRFRHAGKTKVERSNNFAPLFALPELTG